ncbi:hypothetical protein [Erythrobacter sp. HKB08]|uniref:hypothetical protein n=1 Tax=Erythrobacter sp. HKB08 TaxID=2502843 RepID=UPI0010093A31|nr:hypothetical protein [Erythrobacter sp. HKB08]
MARPTKSRRKRGPSIADPARAIVAVLAGLLIAALLALQSISSVTTRRAPDLAVSLMPLNGLAKEQLAARQFTGGVTKADEVVPSAKAATPSASGAFAGEALTPKAIAILALASADPAQRDRILAAATSLNRRDLLLQGLVLEEQVKARDYAGSLATLDRLMRVHPEQKPALFPLLQRALSEDDAIPAFAEILDGSSDWHDDFLEFAVRDPASLAGLASLRESGDVGSEEFERRLIQGLADNGQVDRAYSLFQLASGKSAARGTAGPIDWQADYAPFDWRFADEGGFRAQQGRFEEQAEIYVRGGKGGLIADRLIRAPAGRFAIRATHRIQPVDQVRDVRLQLRCAGSETPFFDERFGRGENLFEVGSAPAGCEFMSVGIQARAWSGRSALRGTIDRLEIVTLAARPEPAAAETEEASGDE